MARHSLDSHPTDHAPTALEPWVMLDIARGVAASRDLWSQHVAHDPVERRPVLLLSTRAYQVWVIGWTSGQGVSLHDHGGSRGVVLVADGQLVERGRAGQTRPLDVGRASVLGPTDVHEVYNAGDAPATSIHVYSPPLAVMGYHLDERGQTVIEGVVQTTPAFTVDEVARVVGSGRAVDDV